MGGLCRGKVHISVAGRLTCQKTCTKVGRCPRKTMSTCVGKADARVSCASPVGTRLDAPTMGGLDMG